MRDELQKLDDLSLHGLSEAVHARMPKTEFFETLSRGLALEMGTYESPGCGCPKTFHLSDKRAGGGDPMNEKTYEW